MYFANLVTLLVLKYHYRIFYHVSRFLVIATLLNVASYAGNNQMINHPDFDVKSSFALNLVGLTRAVRTLLSGSFLNQYLVCGLNIQCVQKVTVHLLLSALFLDNQHFSFLVFRL